MQLSHRRAVALAPLFLLALPAMAMAQAQPAPAPATAVPSVTVQGQASPAVVHKEVQNFVQAHAAATAKIDQIGRWHGGVCVQVTGLIPDQAVKIQARIDDVARSVGLPAQTEGCHSNIQIVFTDQPQAVLDRVAKVSEQYLGFHYQADIKRLKTVTHPIQAWYATATQGEGATTAGLAFSGNSSKDQYGEYQQNFGAVPKLALHTEVVDDPENQTPPGCADAPHFTACLTSVFKNVLIVVDSKAIGGKDLGAVTDYLTMLALSQPKSLDGCSGLSSVIDMFAKSACPGQDVPDGLTPSDAAYLTSLYASDPEAKLSLAKGDIELRMADLLTRHEPR
jgi:hypothetical protein